MNHDDSFVPVQKKKKDTRYKNINCTHLLSVIRLMTETILYLCLQHHFFGNNIANDK